MLCYVMLCYVMLYHITLYCIISYYVTICYIICTILCLNVLLFYTFLVKSFFEYIPVLINNSVRKVNNCVLLLPCLLIMYVKYPISNNES